MTAQQQLITVSAQEPRTTTRLVYGQAIRMAVSDGERNDLIAALGYYETKWQVQDRMAQQAAQQAAQPPNPPMPDAPPPSAVEAHGLGSPEALAKQEARRAARAEAKAGKATEGDA